MLKRPQPSYQMNPNTFATVMVGLSTDEASLIEWLRSVDGWTALRRLRQMQSERHQLAIIQFDDGQLGCREVGRLEK